MAQEHAFDETGMIFRSGSKLLQAVEGAADYWFHELKFPAIRAPKAIANTPSRRISEKSGKHVVTMEERDYIGGRFFSETWGITAEEAGTRPH